MANSKIGICNIALSHVGADSIRSFDEGNKRARLCDVFFDSSRDYILSKFDWNFARKIRVLQQLDLDDEQQLDSMWGYGLPADCLTPRSLYPYGSRKVFEVIGAVVYCELDNSQGDDVRLLYTSQAVDTATYSSEFVNLLALHLALRLCPPISQDKDLMRTLASLYENEMGEAWESDANVGNLYREADEDPNNDSFVVPDISSS